LKSEQEVEKLKSIDARLRTKPNIFDPTYILTKNNLAVFKRFKKLIENENKVKILDVGCGFKPWALLFDERRFFYIGVDFETKSSADIIASAEELPFPTNHFDALIYSEVLEHVGDLDKALEEMRRVVKKGGLVFISSPFFFYEHAVPYDFRRSTRYAYERYFQNEIILLKASNGIFANPFLMFNLACEVTPLRKLPILSHLFYSLNNLLALLTECLSRLIISLLKFLSPNKTFVEKAVRSIYSFPLGYALLLKIDPGWPNEIS